MYKKNTAAIAAITMLIAGIAHAGDGDRGQFQLTPYVGHAQVRIDGQYLEFGDSETFDQWIAGISAGYRAPFGLVAELGTAASGEPMFGWAVGGEVRETYVAVGWDFELGRGWNITPKLGFTNWELQGGDLEDVVDGSGQLRDRIDGEDAYLEVAVTKHLNSHVGLGFSLRHAEVEFGQVSSAAFRFVWSL